MGFKGAIVGAVAKKAITTIASRGEVKESKPTSTNKKGYISPAYDFAINSKKNCFIMESSFFDMQSLNEYTGTQKLKHYNYNGRYKIFDKNGDLQYLSLEKRKGLDEDLISKDIDKLYLFDLNGNIIGRVKEHVISFNTPVIENNSKTCSVFLDDNKLWQVRRYYSFGKEHFETNNENYNLEYTKNNKFIIKKGKKTIATITIFRFNLKERFSRTIVIEYDDIKQDIPTILFAMAIDTVCSY